jgi:chemotaxis protein MotA
MNKASIIGFLCSLAVFLVATLTTTPDFTVFLDWHAMVIVIGGTLAASFVSFSISRLGMLTKVFFRRVLGKSQVDYVDLIKEIVELSQVSRRGSAALSAHSSRIRNPFLRDAAELLRLTDIDVDLGKIRSIVEARAETHFERYVQDANIFRAIAKFPPAFGLLGTTLGMIALLRSLGEANAQAGIGPAMAIALVATLYGIVLANFIFTPIAENLTKQAREDLVARRMVVEGVMLIAEEQPTQVVEEHVKSFLLPSERTTGRPSSSAGNASNSQAA